MSSKSKKKQSSKGRPDYRAVLYHLDKGLPQGDVVRSVLAHTGIPARTIGPEQLADTAGFHGGIKGYRPSPLPYEDEIPSSPFLLFCNVPQKLLDQVLLELKESACTVDCKAVLTKTNRNWRIGDLIKAVADEHATVSTYEAADE